MQQSGNCTRHWENKAGQLKQASLTIIVMCRNWLLKTNHKLESAAAHVPWSATFSAQLLTAIALNRTDGVAFRDEVSH